MSTISFLPTCPGFEETPDKIINLGDGMVENRFLSRDADTRHCCNVLPLGFVLVISGLLEALIWDGGLDDLGIDTVADDRTRFGRGGSIGTILRRLIHLQRALHWLLHLGNLVINLGQSTPDLQLRTQKDALLDPGVGTLVVRIEQAEVSLPALGKGCVSNALGEVVPNEGAGPQDGTDRIVLTVPGDLVMGRIGDQFRIG